MAKRKGKARKPARKSKPPKTRRKPLPQKPPRKQAKRPAPRKPLPRKPVVRKAPPVKRAKPPKRYKRPKTREPKRKPVVRDEPPPLAGPGNVFGPFDLQPGLLDFLKRLVGAVEPPPPTKTGGGGPSVPIPKVRWTPDKDVDEEIGFNLRDTGMLDPLMFLGRDEVTMSVVVTKFEGGRPVRSRHVVTFEPGSDDIDFWYNYHAALREVLGEVGSDVSISVTAMTS